MYERIYTNLLNHISKEGQIEMDIEDNEFYYQSNLRKGKE